MKARHVYETRSVVLPTVPSPTIPHLMARVMDPGVLFCVFEDEEVEVVVVVVGSFDDEVVVVVVVEESGLESDMIVLKKVNPLQT